MGKVLHIKDCYFKLPENFNGTCGNALMLLGLHILKQEKQQSGTNEIQKDSRLNDFWKSNNKCMIDYCIYTEEKIKMIGKE